MQIDGNIDFSEFSQSKYSKISLSNKKLSKNKFPIFIISSIIISIILIIYSQIKGSQLSKKSNELEEIYLNIDNKNKEIDNLTNSVTDIENNLSLQSEKLEDYKLDISRESEIFNNLKDKNQKLTTDKYSLLKEKELLNEKIESLTKEIDEEEDEEIESLKKQIEEIKKNYQLINEKLNNLSIDNSEIMSQRISVYFAMISNTQINDKCYDSIVYDFDPHIFHKNCDGYPLLILIKTDDNENIAAYTSSSNEGYKNMKDDESILMNLDTVAIYTYSKEPKDRYPIYCDPNEFPRFSDDLIINKDGTGVSMFPTSYGVQEKNEHEEFLKADNFNIKNLEIYKLTIIDDDV